MKFCEECEDMMSEKSSGHLCEHCSGDINAYRKANNKPKTSESDIKGKKKQKPRKEKQKW